MFKQVGHLEASARSTSHNPFLPFPAFRNNPHLTYKVVGCFAFSPILLSQVKAVQQNLPERVLCVYLKNLESFLSIMTCYHVLWQDRKTTDSQGLIKHLHGPSQYPTLHSLSLEQVQNLFPARTLLSGFLTWPQSVDFSWSLRLADGVLLFLFLSW